MQRVDLKAVLAHELRRAVRRKEREAHLIEQFRARQKFRFAHQRPGRKQNIFLRQFKSNRQQAFQERFMEIVAETGDFAGGRHFHAGHRIRALQARERELRRFDADIIEVKRGAVERRDLMPHNHLCGRVHEIHAEDFRDERKTPRRPQIALDDLHVAVFGKELNIERAGDFQRFRDFPRNDFDAPHRFQIGALRRQHDARVAGMHARVFDMLGHGGAIHHAVLRHRVNLDFPRIRDEFRDDDRIFFADVRRLAQIFFQLRVAFGNAHRRAAQDVAGPHKHRITDLLREFFRRVEARQLLPLGLIHLERVEQLRKNMPVFGAINIFRRRAENLHARL